MIIQKIRLWIRKYYTSISKNISNYLTIILAIWVCFSACTEKYLQDIKTVEAQETNQEITSSKETSTQSTTDITTLHTTVTPEAFATKTLDVNEFIPGFRPEAWTVYPISDIDIQPPSEVFLSLYINDIAEDRNGMMWFATSYGLVSFDGTSWQLVSKDKEYKRISFVDVAKDGSIWFTMSDGVYQYQSGFVKFQLDGNTEHSNLIQGLSISSSDEIWVAPLDDGIKYYSHGEWHDQIIPFGYIHNIAIDKDDRVYISWTKSEYGGIAYYDKEKWVVYGKEEIEGKPSDNGNPFGADPLIIDNQGHIWFYEWSTGLYEFCNGEFSLQVMHINKGYSIYNPSSIVMDNEGIIWLGAINPEIPLAIYIPNDDEFLSIDGSNEFYLSSGYPSYRYKKEGIIPFENVSALYVDSKDHLWIATELGIYVLDLVSGFPVTTSP